MIKNNDSDIKKNRMAIKKRRELKMKEEMIIFSEYVYPDKNIRKRKEIQTENKQRVPKRQDIFERKERKTLHEGGSQIYPLFKD